MSKEFKVLGQGRGKVCKACAEAVSIQENEGAGWSWGL